MYVCIISELKKNEMKTIDFLPFLVFCLLSCPVFSQINFQQTLSLNNTGAPADASAIFDVGGTNKGMLVPRMSSAQRMAITSPATGLLVFDTDTGSFWYYAASVWVNLQPSWSLTGNNVLSTDFLGTTNSQPLNFKVDNFPAGKISPISWETFLGAFAGQANTSGTFNTAVGSFALQSNTTGSANTAVGSSALYNNTIRSFIVAMGDSALYNNGTGATLATHGAFNTAVGSKASYTNSLGFGNTALGYQTQYFNSTGFQNTSAGAFSLYFNTTGNSNTATGYQALYNNTAGNENTAVGLVALKSNTTGQQNSAIGAYALNSNTTGFGNTANGYQALFSNTSGSFDSASGHFALQNNTVGTANTAYGANALQLNTSGNFNTAVGFSAMEDNTIGTENTATGIDALSANSTGSGNTAIGAGAINTNTTGSNNTALGYGADVTTGALNNATVIGNSAIVNASHKVRFGNTSVTVIEGQAPYTFPSDARFKFNVHDDSVPGLSFINQLRPVTYQFDTRKFDEHLMQLMPDSIRQRRMEGQDYSKSTAIVQTGFLAQEIEQVCKKLGYQFSGLHVPESEVDNYGLAYGSFVPLLVKGIQEQQTIIETQKVEIAALKSQLDKITAALADMGVELK